MRGDLRIPIEKIDLVRVFFTEYDRLRKYLATSMNPNPISAVRLYQTDWFLRTRMRGIVLGACRARAVFHFTMRIVDRLTTHLVGARHTCLTKIALELNHSTININMSAPTNTNPLNATIASNPPGTAAATVNEPSALAQPQGQVEEVDATQPRL